LHAFRPAHRSAAYWLAAIVGAGALLLATPALSDAAEVNPNEYNCVGLTQAGPPELGSEEQQVQYTFYCDGPITGYQLQSQVPLTGIQSPPIVTDLKSATPLNDTFSCSGEIPGYAVNCVGAAKAGYERITGQFAIGTKLCAEPRVDPLLSVTFASVEKTTVTQAISGPFDLGRPKGCPADALSGSTRLNPRPPINSRKKGHKNHKKSTAKKTAGTKK
jgi:hypothetical protein